MKQSIIIILLLLSTSASARETFAEADEKCQAQKNELLQQARKEKIDTCKSNKEFGGEPGGCENFYSDYGNPIFNPKGYQIKKGIFDDIPECQRARELQNTTDRN